MHLNIDKLILGAVISCFIAGCGMGDSRSTEISTTYKNQSNLIYGTVTGRDQDNGAIVAVTVSGNFFTLPTFQNQKSFEFKGSDTKSESMYDTSGLFVFADTSLTSFDIEARFYDNPSKYFTNNSAKSLRSHFDGTPLPAADITETFKNDVTSTISLNTYPPDAAVNINYLTEFAYSLWVTLRSTTPGFSFSDSVAATNTLLRTIFPTYNLPLTDFAKEPLTPAQTLLINNVQFETYSTASHLRLRLRSNKSVICAGPIQQPLTCSP